MPLDETKWETIQGDKGDTTTWDFKAKDKSELVGEYVGFEDNIGAYNSKLYHFRLEDGEMVDVWGCTTLDKRMMKIQVGVLVRIRYLGEVPTQPGKNPYKDFDVSSQPKPDDWGIPTIEE